MTTVQTFDIPGLATVSLDTRHNDEPLLEIVLSDDYQGDLNDIAVHTAGPDNVYLRCNSAGAINNPELAKFVEVMTHWDHTGDGRPDCDEIISTIELAFWQSRETPDVFFRPRGGMYTKALMAIMPPAPDRHIVLSFGELKPRYRWFHYASAIPMIAAFIGLVYVQNDLFPWMKYSVISGFTTGAEAIGVPGWMTFPLFIVAFVLYARLAPTSGPFMSHSEHTYGFFNKAAVFEEQAFREGSEHWSFTARVRSCLAFGAIHMVNLFYPLASILPLALCGAVFMIVYLRAFRTTPFRRTAVLKAAVWHRVYNRIALTLMVIALLVWFGTLGLAMLGTVGILLGTVGLVRPQPRMRLKTNDVTRSVSTSQV